MIHSCFSSPMLFFVRCLSFIHSLSTFTCCSIRIVDNWFKLEKARVPFITMFLHLFRCHQLFSLSFSLWQVAGTNFLVGKKVVSARALRSLCSEIRSDETPDCEWIQLNWKHNTRIQNTHSTLEATDIFLTFLLSSSHQHIAYPPKCRPLFIALIFPFGLCSRRVNELNTKHVWWFGCR